MSRTASSPASLPAGAPPVAEPRPDRRMAILLAAERLFALRGYHAVSLRQIAEEAGVPLALLSYYFGAKHELFIAIFAHWNSTIEARLAALRAVRIVPGEEATLAAIVEAFVLPVLRLRASPEGEYYALLVARQLYQAVDEAEAVLREFFDPMAHAFIDALHAALPAATRAQVAWGYQFMLGALLNHLSDTRIVGLSRGQNRPADPAAAPLLLQFITGGLRAAFAAPPARPKTRNPRRRPSP
ncbi:TetR family transcriptional regulator [Aquabacterium sp.]|uniref:TetR family transcriptional regulator n=1 Tax=Aquabacterium sp. TaxID=1872578 RepID=UPI0037839FFE